MTRRTAPITPEETALLRRIEESSRRVRDLDTERSAEKERRDKLMADAESLGFSYRTIAYWARRGDGKATVSMVRNAILDVLGGRYGPYRRSAVGRVA